MVKVICRPPPSLNVLSNVIMVILFATAKSKPFILLVLFLVLFIEVKFRAVWLFYTLPLNHLHTDNVIIEKKMFKY